MKNYADPGVYYNIFLDLHNSIHIQLSLSQILFIIIIIIIISIIFIIMFINNVLCLLLGPWKGLRILAFKWENVLFCIQT